MSESARINTSSASFGADAAFSSAAAYSRAASRSARDALDGLQAEATESRVFRLGPLTLRMETRVETPEPALQNHITEAARRLADSVRGFNFQEALDAEEALAAMGDPSSLEEAAQTSRTAQDGAIKALDSLVAAQPLRTQASAARSYANVAQSTRRYIPRMINARV